MRTRGEALHAARVQAFIRLFKENQTALRAYVECLLDDDDDEVPDLVADVFALAWVKLDVKRPPGLLWLVRVADNKAKDRERRATAGDRAIEAVQRMSEGKRQVDQLDALAVRHAVDAVLTKREKAFVIRFYWGQLTAGEIAEAERCSQAVVFTTLSRARAKLMVEIGHDSVAEKTVPRPSLLKRRIPYTEIYQRI